ncbi:MAG: hypothetical protein M1504_01235, partial [Candidatus Marsarchaeota archaeon]|nr:hypothetical protein [Candidatus Marsarchaeota archaeon]
MATKSKSKPKSKAKSSKPKPSKPAQKENMAPTIRKVVLKDNKLNIESPAKRARGRPRSSFGLDFD